MHASRAASTPSFPALPAAGASPAKKITIYTAKTIVTLDPGTPTAEAVAVMNGKILGVGTLDEVTRLGHQRRTSRSTGDFKMR